MALSFPILSLFRESLPNRDEGFRKDWTVKDIKCDADQQFTCNAAKHGLLSKSQILLIFKDDSCVPRQVFAMNNSNVCHEKMVVNC